MRLLTVPGLPIGGGDEMQATATAEDQLKQLRADIIEAMAELRGARAVHERCPSNDNQAIVDYAEFRLDRLLNRHPRPRENA